MKWYWYVAKPDELMMDLDGSILLEICKKRLARSVLKDMIALEYITPSHTPDHWHYTLKLMEDMPPLKRQLWQLYFLDHVYRSLNNCFRVLENVPSPSLLISDHKWDIGINIHLLEAGKMFWREPDAICNCKKKHTGPDMSGCKVGLKLRGGFRKSFFE